MEQTIFVSIRQDGLGERLRAILNAIALSNLTGKDFGFYWDNERFNRDGHAIDDATKIFDKGFIKKYRISEEVALSAMPIHSLNGIGKGVYFCNQVVPKKVFDDCEYDYSDFQSCLSNAFSFLRFSSSVSDAIKLAGNFELPSEIRALHLRAGDIIYGRLQSAICFVGKAISLPYALEFIRRSDARGEKILVAGQDGGVLDFLSEEPNVIVVDDVRPSGLGRVESAFFDMVLMSRCKEVYAGNSGFAHLASIIGGIKLVNPEKLLNSNDLFSVIKHRIDEICLSPGVPDEQISFACKKFILHGRDWLSTAELINYCEKGRFYDPDNSFFDFVLLWRFLQEGDTVSAKQMARSIIDKKNNFLKFVKVNSASKYHADKFKNFLKVDQFDESVFSKSREIKHIHETLCKIV